MRLSGFIGNLMFMKEFEKQTVNRAQLILCCDLTKSRNEVSKTAYVLKPLCCSKGFTNAAHLKRRAM